MPIHRVAIVLIDMQSVPFDVHSLGAAANLYLLNALLVPHVIRYSSHRKIRKEPSHLKKNLFDVIRNSFISAFCKLVGVDGHFSNFHHRTVKGTYAHTLKT